MVFDVFLRMFGDFGWFLIILNLCVLCIYILYVYNMQIYIYICIDRFLVDNPGDVHMLADACLLPQLPLLPFKHLLLSLSAFAT